MVSAPSHGGGTRVGSGHSMVGKLVGPYRGASPLALRFSALSTFSGVRGPSQRRAPRTSKPASPPAGITGKQWPLARLFRAERPVRVRVLHDVRDDVAHLERGRALVLE